MTKLWTTKLSLPVLLFLSACAAPEPPATETAPPPEAAAPTAEWAIAIHGGAGVISRDVDEEWKQAHRDALSEALTLGKDMLDEGAEGLDVVEQVIRVLEDSPLFNAGKGSVFTHDGKNELDAAIMDGRDLNCGAISGVTRVKNPISLARLVMTESRHVFFVREGAERFAEEMGVEKVDPEYYFVQRRWDALQKALDKEKQEEAEKHGTVGCVVLDRAGNLAAGTSTGGMTNKRFGRVGDVPVIGAGTYANNATVAVSCTGWGEKFIRNNVAHDVSARIEYKGLGVRQAAEEVIHGKLDEGDGGLIAVGAGGEIAMVFNSSGMFRGAADSNGRFEVGIWQDDDE
ncbi:MAG: isoaspartyl peptidase/L-asparaginase [bacterium]|nr:isoaspartyl peptidase/L-asparaginase [bacterium]